MRMAGHVLVLVASGWFALSAHEAGHVVTGLMLRFRFGLIAVGPLCLVAEGKRIRLRWNGVLSTWGGMAMMVPRNSPQLAAHMALLAAGGPLTSLAVAVAAYWTGASLFPGTRTGLLSIAVALMSGAVFLATVQPFIGTGIGVPSDGGRVLMFLRRRAEAETWARATLRGAVAAAAQQPTGAGARVEPRDTSQSRAAHSER